MSLRVHIRGQGPALALLHGWGLAANVWGPFAESLAQEFTVHAFDLPGHGGSAHDTPLTLEDCVAALATQLPDEVILCGWSLGGMIAQAYAAAHPTRVRALLLIDSTPRFCAGDDWPHGNPADNLTAFAAELEADPATLLARFRASMCRGDANERALRRALTAQAPACEIAALREGLTVLREADLRPMTATLACPTLVLHGEQDNVIPHDAGRWLAAHLPRARYAGFAQCAHLPFLSEPEACATLVRQFARECLAEPTA